MTKILPNISINWFSANYLKLKTFCIYSNTFTLSSINISNTKNRNEKSVWNESHVKWFSNQNFFCLVLKNKFKNEVFRPNHQIGIFLNKWKFCRNKYIPSPLYSSAYPLIIWNSMVITTLLRFNIQFER